jgi:hypothetical protein
MTIAVAWVRTIKGCEELVLPRIVAHQATVGHSMPAQKS